MDNLKKKSFRESHRSIILTGAMIFIGLFLMNFASAELFQFDNVKNYDQATQTVDIRNSILGIPFLQLGKIADVKWNTPLHVTTGYGGVFKVAEFENIPYKDYVNAFDMEKMEFYDINNGMKEITREIEFKVKSYETIKVDDYKEVCSDILSKNGTKSCERVVSGSHEEQREVWLPLEKYDFLKGENKTIGIFTYVYKGDYIELIPNFYGLRLSEFSSWSADLNVGLNAYWNFDNDGTGDYIHDSTGQINGTSVGASNTTGLINSSRLFNDNRISFSNNITGNLPIDAELMSVSLWAMTNTVHVNPEYIFCYGKSSSLGQSFCMMTNPNGMFAFSSLGGGNDATTTINLSTMQNQWVHLVIVRVNATGVNVYVNGTNVMNKSIGTFALTTPNRLVVGVDVWDSFDVTQWNGKIDEIGIWNRTLTGEEITYLYNAGVGCGYGDESCGVPPFPIPQVTLNSPINYYNTTNPAITFNVTATDEQKVNNVTLYIDGILNETDTSNVNGTYLFNKTLNEGNHNWSILTYNNNSQSNQSATRYLSIDTTYPIISTTGITSKYNSTLPINLTWSLFNADLNVDKCWYYTSDNSTNATVVCNGSTITNFTSEGTKTIYYFGNDTFGHQSSGSSNLTIGYYPYNHNADQTSVGEGSSVVFTLYVNGTNINPQFADTNATLNLNGTVYAPDTTDRTNANYTKFTKTITITGGNSTGMIYPFNWTYNVKNSTTTVLTQLTDTKNVTVYSMTITDASVTCGRNILNMTIKNEETNVAIVPATNSTNIQLDLTITSRSNTSLTWNFSKTWIDNVTVGVCVPSATLTSSTYKIDFTVGYKATGFVQEFYYMDNGTLENTGNFNSYTNSNISLMDLESADSTTFLFKFKDENNLEVDDAIIHVFRKYIGDGIFREVERAEQDNNGETHVHLVEEDVIYYFMVSQYGNIIYTSSNYNAKCLSTPCQIELSASSDFTEFPTDYDKVNGTIFTLTSSKTTRTVTLNYQSNSSKVVNLSVFKVIDGSTISYINTTASTGTSGILTLNIPLSSGNETFFASIFSDGVFVRSEWVDMKEKAQDYFGTTGAILGGLIVLALIFMAISEGVILIIIGIVAIFIIGAMQLVDLSWLAIISIICAGALIIWKLTQGGNKR